jgi:hypothetical protein
MSEYGLFLTYLTLETSSERSMLVFEEREKENCDSQGGTNLRIKRSKGAKDRRGVQASSSEEEA